MISGKTTLIAHIGYPTEAFKAPMIYNPFFEKAGIDAVVMPMGVKAEDYPSFLRELFKVTNIRGALVTMPHKKTTIELADEVSPTARIAGAANALLETGGRNACSPTCSTAKVSFGAYAARDASWTTQAHWSSVPVGSGQRSRRRWRPPG